MIKKVLGRLGMALATLGLGGGLFLVSPAATASADSYVEVCNHGSSVTGIRVWPYSKGWDFGRTVLIGNCWSFYDNGDVRIDVDAANRGIGSWKWGHGTPGHIVYKPCYDFRSDYNANPSATWTNTIVVRNYWGNHC